LADLGVSLPHLKEASRGFSFKSDGPLDMRMDQAQEFMASDIVNSYKEDQLAQIHKRLWGRAQSKANRRVDCKKSAYSRYRTTRFKLIKYASPGYSKVHPATRRFQAIRIAVNNELEQLETGSSCLGRFAKARGTYWCY
jgi:16S rRNA (cytosine1402-N4)-methyltransferase